ncbi:hypothetical protein [Paenibacillus gansuensis]|uniref:Uncharacterized protein n=1 Tax=Paenibacillus gansuensis TaxID=306542 RepID=A0ABW5PIE6_9BACL
MSTALAILIFTGYALTLIADRALLRTQEPAPGLKGTYVFLNGLFLLLLLTLMFHMVPPMPTDLLIDYIAPWLISLFQL